MAMYGKLDAVVPGTLDGLNHNIESRVATVAVQFGDPVMYDAGVADKVFAPDSTDASLVFGGVAAISQRSDVDSEGQYDIKDMVSVVTDGEIWVRVPDALTACANKPAFVIDLLADADYKKFTDTAGANTYDSGTVFKSNPISLGVGKTYALVEVRGLK